MMVEFYEFVLEIGVVSSSGNNAPSTYVLDIIPSTSSKNFLLHFGPVSHIINLPPFFLPFLGRSFQCINKSL